VPNVPCAQKSFWTHPMVLLGDEAHVDARLGLFGDSANLDARRLYGLAERTIGSEIVLDTPDGTPR
jgi:hypothetical protein